MLTVGTLKLDVPAVMGILNVTPDSFSDGGRHDDAAAATARAPRSIRGPPPDGGLMEMRRRPAYSITIGRRQIARYSSSPNSIRCR